MFEKNGVRINPGCSFQFGVLDTIDVIDLVSESLRIEVGAVILEENER